MTNLLTCANTESKLSYREGLTIDKSWGKLATQSITQGHTIMNLKNRLKALIAAGAKQSEQWQEVIEWGFEQAESHNYTSLAQVIDAAHKTKNLSARRVTDYVLAHLLNVELIEEADKPRSIKRKAGSGKVKLTERTSNWDEYTAPKKGVKVKGIAGLAKISAEAHTDRLNKFRDKARATTDTRALRDQVAFLEAQLAILTIKETEETAALATVMKNVG